MIQCNEINQNINELLVSFDDCKKIKNEDLTKLVELIAAVNNCANGGVSYNKEVTDIYEPLVDLLVIYPINSFHSYSIMILNGNISQIIGSSEVVYPTGTVLNTEFTNLNQNKISFNVLSGSKVVVKYLIESL